MKAVVTGTTGFIGWHCAALLARNGYEVTALLRPESRGAPPEGVAVARAGYDSVESLAEAVRGAEAVVHCAGVVRALSLDDYWRANVEAAANLAKACREAGVRRFVYMGSLAAGGPSKRDEPRTERMPDRPVTYYGLSKLAGELAARRAFPRTTAFRPCAVFGPRERDIFTVFDLVARRGLDVRPAGPSPLLSFVYGPDVARAVLLALKTDETAGRTYYLSDGETWEWDDFVDAVADAAGRRPRKVRIPRFLVEGMAWFSDLFAALTRRPPKLSREKVFEMGMEAWTCSPARFAADTGFSPRRDLREPVRLTLRWYREQGWLKDRF